MKESHFTRLHNRPFSQPNRPPKMPSEPEPPAVRNRKPETPTAIIRIRNLDVPLISPSSGLILDSISLYPDRACSVGGAPGNSGYRFNDRRVSKLHCQLLFDGVLRKIYILNGVICCGVGDGGSVVDEFRRRLEGLGGEEGEDRAGDRVRVSFNGVFVNGVRVGKGMSRELLKGDEVLLGCGGRGRCGSGVKVGFVVERIAIKEEVVGVNGLDEVLVDRHSFLETACSTGHSQGSGSSGKRNKRVFAFPDEGFEHAMIPRGRGNSGLKCEAAVKRLKFLLNRCRDILQSDDPVAYVRKCSFLDFTMESAKFCKRLLRNVNQFDEVGCRVGDGIKAHGLPIPKLRLQAQISGRLDMNKKVGISDSHQSSNRGRNMHGECTVSAPSIIEIAANDKCSLPNSVSEDCAKMSPPENYFLPPRKKFYLNRLESIKNGSSNLHNEVSLPELLNPVDNMLRIFIATFTSDIPWFLSDCKIPKHLPVTVACHDSERCWSSSPDNRTFVPYPDFPQLVVVCPSFPEAIAFGGDRKKHGIACHHPKLIVLQRNASIRVIITSANLVANQWKNVTNTIWWQDFPRRSVPNVSSLFSQVPDGVNHQDLSSDFAAQLAGFMASLLVDIPSQAHWIAELTKYNFEEAVGYLVASVPGIHSRRTPFAFSHLPNPYSAEIIGTIEASVVGLSHLFHAAADSNGTQLKKLASFLGKCHENVHGLSEVVLRRNKNIPADNNAVSVFVSSPNQVSGDLIQLGFLPRYVAKWVSPLWDSGLFGFTGYIYPKEALAAARGESNTRVQLTLRVSQGHCLQKASLLLDTEHTIAFCSLIAALQRCTGLWRLEEVLGKYKWPESDETDFAYGSSSIGSLINAQFLAAFSAAVGKKSSQLYDSEESDPEWGCWSACQEQRNPSIKIVFPTIERVKNSCNGIFSSRRILCFSEKTWQRLKPIDILHDAVPQPCHRVGHPMHSKVARRCFRSKTDKSSCGWVYCGSHNFSAAAWGRQLTARSNQESDKLKKDFSVGTRLHVCNYELGIIFIFPPKTAANKTDGFNLEDVEMPFVVPAPKYGARDHPATKRAMTEGLAELPKEDQQIPAELASILEIEEEICDEEEEGTDATGYLIEEKEEEKAYAEMLWSQVDSSQSS